MAENGEILALQLQGRQPCKHVFELLDQELAAVDQQLRARRDFGRELLGLREEAARTTTAEACVCGIIECYELAERAEPV